MIVCSIYNLNYELYFRQVYYINKKADDKKETTLIDAAYYSNEIDELAKKKNIELIPTQTMGKKQVNSTVISKFEIDEETHQVLSYPNNQTPIDSKYNEENHVYLAHFDKIKCEGCPFREKCEKDKFIQKTKVSIRFTNESYQKAKLEIKMNTKEYKEISNNHAGIEGTMSIFRRRYNIDTNPSRGLLRQKLKFGGCIASINIKKAIKYSRNRQEIREIAPIFKKIFSISRIFKLFKICYVIENFIV